MPKHCIQTLEGGKKKPTKQNSTHTTTTKQQQPNPTQPNPKIKTKQEDLKKIYIYINKTPK